MNPGLEKLQPYPFEKLAILLGNTSANQDKNAINLSIGEPRHQTPAFILDEMRNHLQMAANYPKTRGSDALRQSIANWLITRFKLPADSIRIDQHILPVNGTREALFAFCQCIIDPKAAKPLVVSANPFYQIYEGAALLAGATPWYINCSSDFDFQPDYASVPESVWRQCQLLYICSPNNPTGSILSLETYKMLLELAEKYDFVIAADECYSEIYFDENSPPLGLLEAAVALGIEKYKRCMVFHSLSKRSNVPGLRSGFVAGDAGLIDAFYQYRTNHGCAMAPFSQQASTVAWQDEEHVRENRRLYREKFSATVNILQTSMPVNVPAASFYLWPQTPISDTEFARGLYQQENVTVLPGSYLSREIDNNNPGANRLRIALVATLEECNEAAKRIVNFINTL